MKILNTLTKKKEEFVSQEKNLVKFYQCGPTVYWNQHIGNMRSVVLADFFVRVFYYLDYEVLFVRNYTDVGHLSGDNDGDADSGEDRMEKAAKKENKSPQEIANFHIEKYEEDLEKLNTIFPSETPKATDFIKEQIEMIEKLLEKGFAYKTSLAIYFDVQKFENYYELSKQKKEKNLKGLGSGKILDKEKKNPEDFSLWFFKTGDHKNDLQFWPSPFENPLVENGNGSPGWHLECSAMALKILGKTLDIKMGGIEHIPTHHTNEIAQSESANEKKYVNYWLHNEHLLVDGKKMSKSSGTSYLIEDIEKKNFSPYDLRLFFAQSHYRSKQNFTWQALESSAKARGKIISKIQKFEEEKEEGEISENYKNKFIEKISDDFNIPEALAIFFEVLDSDLKNSDKKATLLDFNRVLGIFEKKEIKKKEDLKIPKQVEELLNQREEAKKEKDFQKSDELRDKILKLGFLVKDTENGQELAQK